MAAQSEVEAPGGQFEGSFIGASQQNSPGAVQVPPLTDLRYGIQGLRTAPVVFLVPWYMAAAAAQLGVQVVGTYMPKT